MAYSELDSFYVKFKSLWQAGSKACLSIETENGEAFVSLKVSIGRNPSTFPSGCSSPLRKRSPVYYRRQKRRKESRNSIVNESSQTEQILTAEEVDDIAVAPATEEVDDVAIAPAAKVVANTEVGAAVKATTQDKANTNSIQPGPYRTSEEIILERIKTYASEFAKPEYLDHRYEPTCCGHRHVPGRGGHNVPRDGSQCCYHRCRKNPHYLWKKPA